MKIRFPQIISVACITILALSTSCSTDFELNAPYETTPIIYGFIDPSVDTQYVKINRTYLGTGDNAAYASINDSTIFENVDAKVDEVINGQVTNSWTLQEKIVSNVDQGAFYDGTQKVYYFVPLGGIQQDATYKFRASINEGEKIVTAETKVVKDFEFANIFKLSVTQGANLALVNSSSDGIYPSLEMKWKAAENGKRYEASMRFYYNEYTATDTTYKSVLWNLGSIPNSSLPALSTTILGESFYQAVANKLKGQADEADVLKRIGDRLEFIVTVADPTFNTYLEVNEPSLSLVSERPSFTNINGGLGIFASRNTKLLNSTGIKKIAFNPASYRELCSGQYTSAYKFCTDSNAFAIHITTPSPTCQ